MSLETGGVRHFTDIDDLSSTDLETVLDVASGFKSQVKRGEPHPVLERQTLGMVFEKPSTRTRVSFETGMTQLGGHAVFLGPDDIGLGGREPLKDIARTLSGYVDCVMVRLFDHADLEELATHAGVPVVNGLTDDAHPCQTLADLLTIRETVGFDAQVAWVGDGNNVAQSFALGCALAGVDLTVATPPEYGVSEEVRDRAAELGRAPTVTDDPEQAVADADVVCTDVWVSMGEEGSRNEKLAAFEDGGFQVDDDLLAGSDARLMHCLPAHRGEEVTSAVLESDRELVWQQAENRLHAQKGLLVFLLDAV
ncbi:ornithine carbamoyltransferase [Halococcus hamelinensis]|uniref:Ornithine carbamoyltransferase n=1 Tax=Halococcus hamelinensis 100A6 TaxID=1132509 RepID=M0M754_9EURY|nr:ornithine carbamoyltransferase [Halococcus hamelinensis]EMA40210.1 ornithine carbamoyltransferase [Halococcus hamelinensis 100A6]